MGSEPLNAEARTAGILTMGSQAVGLKAVTRVENGLPFFVKGHPRYPAKTTAMPLVHRKPWGWSPEPARP